MRVKPEVGMTVRAVHDSVQKPWEDDPRYTKNSIFKIIGKTSRYLTCRSVVNDRREYLKRSEVEVVE